MSPTWSLILGVIIGVVIMSLAVLIAEWGSMGVPCG